MFPIGPNQDQGKSWSLFSAFGIPIYFEFGYLLFAGLIYLFLMDSLTPVEIGLVELIFFLSLVFHELGHALAARWAGCDPQSIRIVLRMFGGYASHEPTTRGKSLVIVLAGPACTLILIVISVIALNIPYLQANYAQATDFVFLYFAILNGILFVFNIMPIYPLDGGQALFHTLSFWRTSEQSLLWTAKISIATSILIGIMCWQMGFVFFAIFCGMFAFQNFQILQVYGRTR